MAENSNSNDFANWYNPEIFRDLFTKMTVMRLKQECRNRNLLVSGRKNVLIDRIIEYEMLKNNAQNSIIDLTMEDSNTGSGTYHISRESGSHSGSSSRESGSHSGSSSSSSSTMDRPHHIQARIDRALTQRLYLIDRVANLDNHTFRVIGSTGNLYTVSIGNSIKCDCPDPLNTCKHIIFVLCKILRIPSTSPVITQTKFSPEQMIDILSNEATFQVSKNDMANQRVINALHNNNDDNNNIRKSFEQDAECPICYESLDDSELVWCKLTCGNNFHKDCFTKWANSTSKISCPLCRSPWINETGSKTTGQSQYTNLSHLT